jgi:hypothetical protein
MNVTGDCLPVHRRPAARRSRAWREPADEDERPRFPKPFIFIRRFASRTGRFAASPGRLGESRAATT